MVGGKIDFHEVRVKYKYIFVIFNFFSCVKCTVAKPGNENSTRTEETTEEKEIG